MGNALTRLLGRGKRNDETSPAHEETSPADEEIESGDESEATQAKEGGVAEPADRTATKGTKAAAVTALRSRFGAWLGRPMTSFHLLIAVAALLTTLGLIMVLSASGVRSYGADGSAWVIFGKQVLWTIIGLLGCYASMRMSVRFIRRMAFTSYAITIILLVLVLIPGIGNLANGSRKWFVIAGFSMQPSELAKIAFAIWGAHLLAARRMERASLREMLIPLVPAAVVALALVVAQPDLGQTVSLGIILLGLLWYAGLPLRVFVSSLAAVFVAGAILAMSAGYRSDRVRSWLDPENDPQDTGYQARQAKFALAHGGIFGDGLGQGTAKWNYLPNAHNDFIFAIIGEELGLVGALGLLGLFGLFAYTGMRIARRSADPFLRLLTATTTFWVLGQAFINIGYVIGMLPVTGLQLPLISAGGTSTATTLFMIGIMANAARHEPEAVAALRAGRDDKVNRLLRLRLPQPYVPSRIEAFRDRKQARPKPANPAKGAAKAQAGKSPRKPVRQAPERALPRTADRRAHREGHHGFSDTPGSVILGAYAHWKVSVTGERHGHGTDRRAGGIPLARRCRVVGQFHGRFHGQFQYVHPVDSFGRWRHRRSCGARDGGRRRAQSALDPRVRITALGTERGLETRLVPERGYHLELITPVPLPRKPTGDLARLPRRVWRAVRETRAVLDLVDADVVVGFGGYVALPAYLAARGIPRGRRVPVLIHEANARAGIANRVGARTADRILSAVPDSGLAHAEVVGVPVRATIAALDRAALRAEARAHFGFPEDARVLLVFGGSQGAVSLNRAVSAAAADLAAAGVCVLHAHGPKNTLELRTPQAGDPPYVALPYLDRMDLAYAAADLAICRSGAMTVAEVSAVGLPAIYVPLPIGNGEQRLNALPVVNAGGGMLVADADLAPGLVAREAGGLLNDPARLAAMTAAAARVGHPDAARQVAQAALDIARLARDNRKKP